VQVVIPVDGDTFVATLKPLLERQDLHGLVETVQSRWRPRQILPLLSGVDQDARKVALLTLAWVGETSCIPDLLQQLRDGDDVVHGMAEHALWSIFFRSGSAGANHEVCRGTKLLDAGRFDEAERHFTRATQLDPGFAEAYNQRAVSQYLRENYSASFDDCELAIARMPCHFGAWSGKGHALLQLGRLREAAACYRKALDIHPYLDCVRETLDEIESRSGTKRN
jgi:tetratricopeptide (TPR) repeat protein